VTAIIQISYHYIKFMNSVTPNCSSARNKEEKGEILQIENANVYFMMRSKGSSVQPMGVCCVSSQSPVFSFSLYL